MLNSVAAAERWDRGENRFGKRTGMNTVESYKSFITLQGKYEHSLGGRHGGQVALSLKLSDHSRSGVLKVLTAEGQFRNPKFD